MSDQIQREVRVPAPAEQVWNAVTGDGWLADGVSFELVPGGDATFRSTDGAVERTGWVEDVCTPADACGGAARLTFWWAADDEPASRVELTVTPDRSVTPDRGLAPDRPAEPDRGVASDRGIGVGGSVTTVVRVVETRPLDRLELVGTPLHRARGGQVYGPALVAA